MLILFNIFFVLSLGYAKKTFSNLILPIIFYGLIPFSGFTILGILSIMLNILDADCLPSAIFFSAGES
jgi:hypothetical protein